MNLKPMTLVLNKWNALISGTLNPSNGFILTLNRESINELISQSEAEQEAVRSRLVEGIQDKHKMGDRQLFVQVNQAILIRLLDKIYSYKQDPKITETVLCLYKTVSQHLENVLDFIEDFFSNYFDRNEKVPAVYLLISIEELCRQLEQFRKYLKSRNSIGSKLAAILIRNFDKFCKQKITTVTYNELTYQKDLMNELLAEGTLLSEEHMKVVLFYFNFNDYDYIAFLYGNMKDLIEALSNKKERIAALRLEQKNINQLPKKLNCHLSSTVPSIRNQVNHWIDEEIKFLEADFFQNTHGIHTEKHEEFVHVAFKGPEIYLLHKAFIDAGGCPTETYKSLLEKTSRRLSNKNQKGFSAESLKKASDKLDLESKENVKRFLQRMIRNIDSYD